MAVRAQDILLRVSPRNIEKYNSLAVAGAGRGRAVPLPYTFTRASVRPYLDQDGKLQSAAADILPVDYTPFVADVLVWPDGTPMGGIALAGQRTNLVTWSDALSNWTSTGTPVVTDAFATLGDLGLTLIEDDDAVNLEMKTLAVTFTGDGVKAGLFSARAPDTPADGNLNRFRLRDVTVGADRFLCDLDWDAAGLLTVTPVTGTVLSTKKLGTAGGEPVYEIHYQTTSVTAANSHQVQARPSGDTGADVGKIVIGGVMVEDAVFPSLHRQKTTGATATRAADSLTVPYNFGPSSDLTVLARMARPIHADVSGDLGNARGIVAVGDGVNNQLRMYQDQTTRLFTWNINTATTDATATQAIPAGSELVAVGQYRLLTSGGLVRGDSGAGFTTEAGPATAFSAFGNQTLAVGRLAVGQEFDGLLLDLIVARGLHSRAEMIAASDA